METYKVVSGVLRVGAGACMGLTPGQAGARAGVVEPVEGRRGVYRAKSVLDFKTGEILGLEDIEAIVGKGQLSKLEEASEDDLRALHDKEQAADAAGRKAKAAAREKAKTLGEQKSALGAAREEGRKAGYAEGFKAGEARGDKAGHARGLAESRAAAEAAAAQEKRRSEESEWRKGYQDDPKLWEKFKTVEAYIEDRRKAPLL